MRDGTRMRLDLRSEMQVPAFWTGQYDADILSLLRAVVKPGGVVLDVGANIGFYAIALGHHFRRIGGGTVHAFEPARANYAALVANVELNGLQDIVKPLPLALGNEEGEIDLYTGREGAVEQTNAVLVREGVTEFLQEVLGAHTVRTDRVRIACLDRVSDEQSIDRCDLVKVDIEGAELEFLRGGEQFLRRHKPVIFGEFNAIWMDKFGYNFVDVAQLVTKWDYRLYRYEGRGRFAPIQEPKPGIEHVLMTPRTTDNRVLAALGIQ